MRNFFMALVAVAAITGCTDSGSGSNDTKSNEAVSPAAQADSAAGEHKGLSPEYLKGAWCFTHIEFPDKRTEENLNYSFETDGTYAAQQSNSRPLQSGWKYTFLPDGKFKLTLPRFTTTVVSVEPMPSFCILLATSIFSVVAVIDGDLVVGLISQAIEPFSCVT